MAKVTGLGGVFYVVEDPAATRAWYRDVLGIDGEYGPQLDWSEETGDKPYSLISISACRGSASYSNPWDVHLRTRLSMVISLQSYGSGPMIPRTLMV